MNKVNIFTENNISPESTGSGSFFLSYLNEKRRTKSQLKTVINTSISTALFSKSKSSKLGGAAYPQEINFSL